MSGSVTFKTPATEAKTATPLPEGTNPDVQTNKNEDVPISLHEEFLKKPYSSTYFGMDAIWNESESLADDLKAIDAYFRSRVYAGELKDSDKAFESLLKQAEKVTDTKDAGDNLKVAKIAEYMRFMERMDEIEKQRKRWQ